MRCIQPSTSLILHINRTLPILQILRTLRMGPTIDERITGRAAVLPG